MSGSSTHPSISWPAGLEPTAAHLHAVNSLAVALAPAQLWPWLIRATRWHDFYANCRHLRLTSGSEDLYPGAEFRWWTFGIPVHTVVDDFVPAQRLAWRGTGLGATGYHAWILEPTPNGCRLITEETQRGAVVSLGRPWLRRGLLVQHQRWLEGLAHAARFGHPDIITRSTLLGSIP